LGAKCAIERFAQVTQSIYICVATPSNCGNLLKLYLPSIRGNSSVAELIALGMVKMIEMNSVFVYIHCEMDNPQPSPKQ